MDATAYNFFKKFSESINKVTFDDYTLNGRYTNVIIDILKEMLVNDFGLNWSKEYYRLDLCAWESTPELISTTTMRAGLKPYLWNLKIAIEHENDKKLWLDELVKLIHIHCPLKVLIGYTTAICVMMKYLGI